MHANTAAWFPKFMKFFNSGDERGSRKAVKKVAVQKASDMPYNCVTEEEMKKVQYFVRVNSPPVRQQAKFAGFGFKFGVRAETLKVLHAESSGAVTDETTVVHAQAHKTKQLRLGTNMNPEDEKRIFGCPIARSLPVLTCAVQIIADQLALVVRNESGDYNFIFRQIGKNKEYNAALVGAHFQHTVTARWCAGSSCGADACCVGDTKLGATTQCTGVEAAAYMRGQRERDANILFHH